MPVHKFITFAAIVTGVAQFIFLYNLFYSRFKGKPAPQNPWEALRSNGAFRRLRRTTILEASHPVVYHDPYQYGMESSTGDYVMQDSPEQVHSEARREVKEPAGVWNMATTIHEPPKIEEPRGPSRATGFPGKGGWGNWSRGWRSARGAGLLSSARFHRHLGGDHRPSQ